MPLRLTFHGASRCVTGSCFRLETDHGQLLVDCGMFQGPKTEKELNYRPFPFVPGELAAVILSHAHIDHSGLLPKLTRHGYARADLRHAGHRRPCRRHAAGFRLHPGDGGRAAQPAERPPRTSRRSSRSTARRTPRAASSSSARSPIRPGSSRCRASGRGSGMPAISSAPPRSRSRRRMASEPSALLFSADIGPDYKLLHPDPTGPSGLDYILCEGTYGDRDRIDATAENRRIVLRDEVRAALNPKGALLIPSFAVERAQELISDLVQLMREGELPEIPIYVDSPLASKATQVFAEHAADLDDGDDLVRGLSRGTSASPRRSTRARRSTGSTRFPHRHRGERHVRGRPHPPPPQELDLARRSDGPAGRLPGGRAPSAASSRTARPRSASRARNSRSRPASAPSTSIPAMPTGRNSRPGSRSACRSATSSS